MIEYVGIDIDWKRGVLDKTYLSNIRVQCKTHGVLISDYPTTHGHHLRIRSGRPCHVRELHRVKVHARRRPKAHVF